MDMMSSSRYKLNWMTTREVAERLDENPRHVRYLIAAGYLPAKKTGDGQYAALLVHQVELDEYIDSLKSR